MHALSFLLIIALCSAAFSQDSIHIAINRLDAKGVSQDDADIITSRVSAELFKTGQFVLVEREALDEILKEQGFQQSGCVSDECIVQMGKLAGVEQIITGTVSKLSFTYSLMLRRVDVATGRIISMVSVDQSGIIDGLLKHVPGLVAQLTQVRNADSVPIPPRPPIAVPFAQKHSVPPPEAKDTTTVERGLRVPVFPFQIAFASPAHLINSKTTIIGLRIDLIYGHNRSVYGVDAGLINRTDLRMIGIEAGLINIGKTNGILQAGLVNVTGSMFGLQAGLVNVAKRLYGLQIGLVNVSREGPGAPFMPIINFGF
ncbi:MAG: hypothetical protein A2487_18170 [Candidatus Raymondbacteria bacterium RifOxyC12_full_50_8]|uniref:FlgO domain-containing protein n=1 Tax=Candidatus Raymondbacteria bacterium RIFOXYD12_FULL_49_13 TaxID=1817890 RepID=A0A1F7F580_UNCRA|nr:MAG: hypothetical protein A2350_19385 [Candidatus Raymondbacteria bacterium RifOxyB12_full_50_8]OGJ87188.1 MAG: hypothetical protein A2248_04110 [Candidatus Raymondbacteria bacterium RIFOXYA2_FULL_49_16]OGJ95331.1 MAG: hypothetical protein A2487_18170 [Candidatus Raymondbacteria bacterium RifOxyC12_full_50_8]OGK01810.1 MAG: hypothetical protein A2519_03015 [Candidatus Raymondbacteria bacterium RIFOXYD12_FULL_49_13]OGP41184.1 MAG: hypothetical protein A2324_08755 [Candidatus Raymondbacteria b